ncbi:MAG: hypothetical protein DWQ31_10455 [Planctomycetota bacterium]|nr:MAG: hypothetical protein DWQ31_10455 [Planctomycetota bacterium]
MNLRLASLLCCLIAIPLLTASVSSAKEPAPDYGEQVAPILRTYCAGCHNADDAEGDLALESYADLFKGGASGPALTPGMSETSRLVRVLTGEAEPAMPPEGEAQPTPAEIATLKAWIDAGAKGPEGTEPDRTTLLVPKIAPEHSASKAVSALRYSPNGKLLAVGRFGEVELRTADGKQVHRTLGDHVGKVNMIRFSADGERIFTASGIVGLYGEVRVWNATDGKLLQTIRGHRDTLYAAVPSPDGRHLATGSYDRAIILWDLATGEEVRRFPGHNGAIYDLAFSPDGRLLASASGDATVKIWRVDTGQRLDTLSQPLSEQFAVAFSPDGTQVIAGGADNRIRVWQLVSIEKPRINPVLFARFAHEGAVVQLGFSPDGRALITVGEERTIKVWDTRRYTVSYLFENQPEVMAAMTVAPDGQSFVVGRMDGELEAFPFPTNVDGDQETSAPARPIIVEMPSGDLPKVAEVEPNDAPGQATPLPLPGSATGVIHPVEAGTEADADLFRFKARANEQWIFETNAQRSKSPLDTKIEILHEDGKPVLWVNLQAVRDSYITFRPIDSGSRGVRLFNSDEMHLNQYVYMRGEVCKLWRMGRGPDSDLLMYPHEGLRWGYFGTSGTTHAMNETVYIVEPIVPGAEVVPNGLPVFPIYYENDDESRRKFRRDSRLTFTAPADGTYLVRVTDVRGFHGEDFSYTLTARPPQPDFTVRLDGDPKERKTEVAKGSGKRIRVVANRMDGFEGEIRIDITGAPPGFHIESPVTIEAGHLEAFTTIHADADATAPTDENKDISKVTATATVDGETITKDVGSLGEIRLLDKPQVLVYLEPLDKSADRLVIAPGTTIKALLRVERHGFDDRINFRPLNLPHGVIVDNIGLNGIMIVEGQTEREIFLSAEKWVPNTERNFAIETLGIGSQASRPIVLEVRRD